MRLFKIFPWAILDGVINVKNKAVVKAVGERIRELRNRLDLSQEALANEADIPLSQIGRIERGETNPTISTLFAIAQALQVELAELVTIKIRKH